jgi:hypothetical protein
VRKLAPSGGWQTAPAAVARRVVEDGQQDARQKRNQLCWRRTSVTRRPTPQVQSEVGSTGAGGTGSGQRGAEGRVEETES